MWLFDQLFLQPFWQFRAKSRLRNQTEKSKDSSKSISSKVSLFFFKWKQWLKIIITLGLLNFQRTQIKSIVLKQFYVIQVILNIVIILRTKVGGRRTICSGQHRSQRSLARKNGDQAPAMDRHGHSLHLLQHDLVVPGDQAQLFCKLPNPLPNEHHHDLRFGYRRSNFGGRWSSGLPGHDPGPQNPTGNRQRFLTYGSVLRYKL